jgi:hypothetical protein
MEWLSDPQAWLALVTLTALEIVLGIISAPRPSGSAWPWP